MRKVRELPFNVQVDSVKNYLKRLMDMFQDNHFDTEDMSNHQGRQVVGAGKVDRIKVLRYLAELGEIDILKEDGDFIDFKITEKFGKIPEVTIDIPVTNHIIESFNNELPKMMSAYALLAAFENRLRFFISSLLKQNKGSDWWETSVPKKVKDKIRTHRLDDLQIQLPKHNIQLTTFSDLIKIINNNWDVFEEVFKNQTHIKVNLESLEIPRNTIAHSNVLSKSMHEDLEIKTNNIHNIMDRYESKSK